MRPVNMIAIGYSPSRAAHTCLALFFAVCLLCCALPGPVLAQLTRPAPKETFAAALPPTNCTEKPHPGWTEAEQWAWRRICQGQPADFDLRYSLTLDPANKEQWTAAERRRRLLRPAFIDMILFQSPWKEALPRLGVTIKGALFEQDLSLYHGEITRPLALNNCRLEKNLHMAGCRTEHFLTFLGTVVLGNLNLVSLRAGPGLVLSGGRFGAVNLTGAQVQGNLEMENTTVIGPAEMSGIKVGRFLIMRQGKFQQTRMYMAEVGLQADLSQAVFAGMLSMNNLRVAGSIFLTGGSFQAVDMMTAVIGNNLIADSASFAGDFRLDGAKVAQLLAIRKTRLVNLSMVGVEAGGEMACNGSIFSGLVILDGLQVQRQAFLGQASYHVLRLVGAKIGQILNLQGASCSRGIMLNNLRVGQNLILSSGSFAECRLAQAEIGQALIMVKAKFSLLDLRGTKVATVWDGVDTSKASFSKGPWPDKLYLDGFAFQKLGGSAPEQGTPLAQRPADWFTQWLRLQQEFSPLPYEHVAGLLKSVGQPQEANDLLYAKMEREREEAAKSSWSRWLWLSILKWAVGYGLGYRQFMALLWLVVIVAMGVLVLNFAPEARRKGKLWLVALSFERLIPIEYFSKEFEDFSLQSWPKYYFIFFHQPAGYILIFFVVAAATGLVGG